MMPRRRPFAIWLWPAVMLVMGGSTSLTAQAPPPPSQPATGVSARARLSTRDLAKKASASMVTVTTPTGQGSGVIVDATGVFVTNLHVVRGDTTASVKLANGDVYDDVAVVDVDERKDLVLLKIKAFGLIPAVLGNSDQEQAGDRVVLIGSPRGLEQSVSDGLISGVRDSGEGYRLFQTSAAASPGSSGGGMFNEFGELIGIVSSKLMNGENLNFGIPVNYMRGLLSSQSRMTLTELAEKFAPDTDGDADVAVTATASTSVSPGTLARIATILSDSALPWTKATDTSWTTEFKGDHRATVTVFVSIVGDLVISQSVVATSARLSAAQTAALLRMNFVVDLVKLSLAGEDGDLVALNETELRLLDGPGLKRIVSGVAVCADDVAGALGGESTALAPARDHSVVR
jgi:S1-C subfamily serine protease